MGVLACCVPHSITEARSLGTVIVTDVILQDLDPQAALLPYVWASACSLTIKDTSTTMGYQVGVAGDEWSSHDGTDLTASSAFKIPPAAALYHSPLSVPSHCM